MSVSLQVAFDSGAGSRGISYARENPYSADTQPFHHAAWEQGWDKADAEINASVAKWTARQSK